MLMSSPVPPGTRHQRQITDFEFGFPFGSNRPASRGTKLSPILLGKGILSVRDDPECWFGFLVEKKEGGGKWGRGVVSALHSVSNSASFLCFRSSSTLRIPSFVFTFGIQGRSPFRQ